ncbi:phage protein NinX family protein [Proteus mirabilis]|uniref:phage protein NinX family protein n=1 Tax=Proteus mirabilis TaxID=584 RepID=UPI003F1A6842
MNSYNKYTDLQINELVARRLKKKCLLTEESVLAYMDSGYRTFAPCNNPTDAMPIIIENEISMIKSSGGWMCCHGSVGLVERESLYRGAMEVLLMMKDAENEG